MAEFEIRPADLSDQPFGDGIGGGVDHLLVFRHVGRIVLFKVVRIDLWPSTS